jgi:hypothetical protein
MTATAMGFFILGLFLGTAVGLITFGLMGANKRDDNDDWEGTP